MVPVAAHGKTVPAAAAEMAMPGDDDQTLPEQVATAPRDAEAVATTRPFEVILQLTALLSSWEVIVNRTNVPAFNLEIGDVHGSEMVPRAVSAGDTLLAKPVDAYTRPGDPPSP